MKTEKNKPLFYVQDARTYTGNSVTWWCPEGKGYTTHIDLAGKFTAAECAEMRGTDIPWPVEEVDKIWSHHVDVQQLRRLPGHERLRRDNTRRGA